MDTSNNQDYINNSNSGNLNPDEVDDDDDLLLTQALDEQEAKNDSLTPPSKKQRSLVQTLFEESDSVMELDNNSTEVTKLTTKISFANLLETSKDSDEDEDAKMEHQSKSIYIEETDSEDD